MRVYFCDQFVLPLPSGHRFPMGKYARLRARVEAANQGQFQLRIPPAARDREILLAHDADYLQRVITGDLGRQELRALGFPWSAALVERSRRSVGATIAACRAALTAGAAVNLAGGTHHAYGGRPQGFCVFNDAAIAARVMQREGRVERVAIVDCDVHQGNGSAAILAGDDSIFTLSLHGEKNFPVRKERSDLDVELPDACDDATYLAALREHLPRALAGVGLVIYLAGADPYHGDRLGRLGLSKAGLAERDRAVFQRTVGTGIPVAVAMAGGYAENVEDIVDIHLQTVAEAARWCETRPALAGS